VRLALLVEMAFWEGELDPGSQRTHNYNCEYCERRGLFNDRSQKQCFRYYDQAVIPVATITEGSFQIDQGSEEREVCSDEVLEELAKLRRANPARGYWELSHILCICPTSLLSDEDWEYLALEGSIREYGAGYLSVYGYDPPPSRLLEAMEVIRSTRNQIEGRKWAKIKKGNKKNGR
jgi:hypothetical protein